jgi:3-oxosteroid 1-dehydrogenase
MQWDYTTDFLVVGSGAGGMTAAIVANELGADSLVIEKTAYYGGTTALSGGVAWIPNNDSMAAAGIADSEDDGLNYLRAVVGPAVAEDKLLSYVRHGREMVRFMAAHTPLTYVAADRYADYYPDREGGKPGGRSMDPSPISRRKLGAQAQFQREPPWQMAGFMKFAVTVNESREMMDMSAKGTYYMIRNIIRYYLDIPSRLKGLTDNRLTLGKALVANCRKAMLDRNIPLWLNSCAEKLIVDSDRVVGVQISKDGKRVNIRASKAVLLAAGGMGRNIEMRQHYGQLPTGEGWSSDSPGNVGDGIRMGLEVGAAVEFMGSAWWTPSIKLPDGVMMALISGKSMPGSFFVDGSGRRFCNEAAPYEDVIKAFWKNHASGTPTVPCHMIFDARFRHQYMAGPIAPGKLQPDAALPKEYFDSGFLKKADSLKQLAAVIGVDADALASTVARHNEFARSGKDVDFARGDSSHDRYYSDPSIKPNPNLAPLLQAPFYAMEIYPGDLGTKGGLKFDRNARVLDTNNEAIAGLYVTGNCAGSVMGDSYPGAGSTIGPSMTFGYVAAKHALGEH